MLSKGITHDYGKILEDINLVKLQKYLKDNRSIWRHISEYEDESKYHPLNFIGSPVYMGEGVLYKQYRKKFISFLNSEPILQLQTIISKNLEIFFKRPIVHLPYTSLPGFHIFNATLNNPYTYTGGFHEDSQLFADRIELIPEGITMEDVYACAIIIEVTSSGDGLDYFKNDIEVPADLSYRSIIKFDEQYSHLKYEVGHMYMWKSKTVHRVAESKLLTDNDYRITYQMHLIQTPECIYYYW